MKKLLIPVGTLISGAYPIYELTRLILVTDGGVSKYGWRFSFVIELYGMWIIYLGVPLAIFLALGISEIEERIRRKRGGE